MANPISELIEYTVWWYDANGAGEQESGIQYRGCDRVAAIEAKKYAKNHCCDGGIDIRLLWNHESRIERILRLEKEAWEDDSLI